MLRESSKKVIWRSVVVVGAAVVDSGIMTETVAVSARKGDMNVKYFAGGCENISSLFFFILGWRSFFFAYFLYKRFSGQENDLLTFFFFANLYFIYKSCFSPLLFGANEFVNIFFSFAKFYIYLLRKSCEYDMRHKYYFSQIAFQFMK